MRNGVGFSHRFRYLCDMKTKHAPMSNLLINAKFALSDLEGRVFLALLNRIEREEGEFSFVEFRKCELLSEVGVSNKHCKQVRAAITKLYTRSITFGEVPPADAPEDAMYTFMKCRWLDYQEEKGNIFKLKLAGALAPHLLELKKDFTFLQIASMMKMRPHARRIYMFAKQYLAVGRRVMAISELVACLELSDCYHNYAYLHRDVLHDAETQINADSDIVVKITPCKDTKGFRGKYQNIIFNIKPKNPNYNPKKALAEKQKKTRGYASAKGNEKVWDGSHFGDEKFKQAHFNQNNPKMDAETAMSVPF